MKALSYTCLAVFTLLPASVWATVTVSSPSNGETVSASANYVATATATTCSKGVASMGVYVDGVLGNVVNGNSMNTTVSLTLGNHSTVVQEWDYCGGSTYAAIAVVVAAQNGVWVTSPVANSTVTSLANYVATATSNCSKGVGSMGIYVNSSLVYVVPGAKLNTQISLSPGAQHTVVEEWDNCGGATYSTVNVTVASTGTKLANLQSNAGWENWGQLPPIYADCSPCTGLNWSMVQGVKSPSLSGDATQFNTSGTTAYGAVLWVDPVIGDYSTQGLSDQAHTLVPSLHNFIYDTDFYETNDAVSQAIEFDVSMYINGVGMFFGTQCNHLGGGEWDVLNNVTQQWATAGVPCNVTNGWNHLTLQFQRESDNSLLYQSITLNGVTYNIDKTYAPFQVPVSWYGVTVNYQMDGNSKQSSNTSYLDNLSLTYW